MPDDRNFCEVHEQEQSDEAISGVPRRRLLRFARNDDVANPRCANLVWSDLVCRQRDPTAPTVSRRGFLRELYAVLPEALLDMTHGGLNSPVAPVDLSQAINGPGMAIVSKYAAVLEADGTPKSRIVYRTRRTAQQ